MDDHVLAKVAGNDVVPWVRLWRRMDTADENTSLSDGFLQTWHDLLGFESKHGPQPLVNLLAHRCLVLCGEPGIGKTTEIERIADTIKAKAKFSGGGFYARSFRESLDPGHLLKHLEDSTEWKDWLAGKELTILIDGVDEGIALAFNLINALKADLREKPVSRLNLILVCRDAEWPLAEGKQLLGLWPMEQAARFQLQRLRSSDAVQAAAAWGLSTEEAAAFMDEVSRKGLEPFAARPITLRMLVQDFQVSRQLGGTRSDIYHRACLRLCREDPGRSKVLKKIRQCEFTAEQLLPVASRIAAWMMLCRCSAISEVPTVRSPGQHLHFHDFIPTNENQIGHAKLGAILESALFSDAGQQSRRFAHQSYMEFLAAEYLNGFDLEQILNLVTINHNATRSIAPQLAELSAWLALRNKEFLDWIIENEPEILLRNDASPLTDTHRSKLVAGLLHRWGSGRAIDDWSLKRYFRSLLHPGLAAQVKPYLLDRTANTMVRRAAIHLAHLGKVSEVLDELIYVAKNVREDSHLREQAINAVLDIIPANRLKELQPFAFKQVGADRDDELRGAALKALVPKLWSVSKALDAIILPRNSNVDLEFSSVCSNYLPNHVTLKDLPELFAKLTIISNPFNGYQNPVRPIAEKALRKAFEHLAVSKVAKAFVNFVRTKLNMEEFVYGLDDVAESLKSSQTARRRLAELFVRTNGMSVQEIQQLATDRVLILTPEDTPWLIKNLKRATSIERKSWALLIGRMRWQIVESPHRELLYEACQKLPALAKEIRWPGIVDLESEAANFSRQFYKTELARARQPKSIKPSAAQYFQKALANATQDAHHWKQLALELQRDADRNEVCGICADPTNLDPWKRATPKEQEQVVQCAIKFLKITPGPKGRPQNNAEDQVHDFWALWIARGHLTTDNVLRVRVIAERFELLCNSPFQGSAAEQLLTKVAVELNQRRAGECLRYLLERTRTKWSSVSNVLSGFQLAWKSEFTRILINFIHKTHVTGYQLRHAVEFLAHHDVKRTRTWLTARLLKNDISDEASVSAAALAYFPTTFWKSITNRVAAKKNFGIAVLQALADINDCSVYKPLEKLIASQLSELFLLLEKHYSSEKPIKLTAEQKEPRERLEKLRSLIPQKLQSIATIEACDELARLAQLVPHWRDKLTWRLCETRQEVLRSRWAGVPIEILRRIEECREARWVRSEDDLLLLTMDSLRRFQQEFNGSEFPLVRNVWNEGKALSPKHESALTEQIVRWLKEDLGRKNGVALGCQVKPTIVHETDIELTASLGGAVPSGIKSVLTIEVKCSFNKEVATSLEKQLSAEYLKNLGRTHGIYAVGWFKAAGWKSDNNPLKANSHGQADTKVGTLLAKARLKFPSLRLDAICLNCEFPQAFRKRL